jgi:hypothetical protein
VVGMLLGFGERVVRCVLPQSKGRALMEIGVQSFSSRLVAEVSGDYGCGCGYDGEF